LKTEDTQRGRAALMGRAAMGERLGGFIYGTILVLSVVIAGNKAYPSDPGHIAAFVAVTIIVFWLAHVYSHGLAHSVGHDEHLSFAELRRIALRESSLLEAAVPSVAALLAGALGLISEQAAIWLALALGLVVLATQGFLFARAERLAWLGTLVVVALNLGFGLLLIALKLVVGH
jgi:hypothetical protein